MHHADMWYILYVCTMLALQPCMCIYVIEHYVQLMHMYIIVLNSMVTESQAHKY